MQKFHEVTCEKLAPGVPRTHAKADDFLRVAQRFQTVDEGGLLAQAKDLCRLIANRIGPGILQQFVKSSKGRRWGSLKSLENVLASRMEPSRARAVLTPLVGVYGLRLADAHLPATEYVNAFKLAGIGRKLPHVMQGRDLLHACDAAVFQISRAIDEEL